jgi:hypothetical protein
MKERSEDEIISRAPIKVTLGSAQYDLKPLPILKAREWRTKLIEVMQTIVGDMSAEQSTITMGPALTAALVAFPEKVADLVFQWEPVLPAQTILEEATEEQVAVAFATIMRFAYPFLAQLATTVQVTKSQLK